MRAMSWYQQQGEKNMRCNICTEGCSEHERCAASEHFSKPTLPCVSFVPARAAYHEIKPGTLIEPTYGVHDGAYIKTVAQGFIHLGVGPSELNCSFGGVWDKKGLRKFGEALMKLSEYMSE